LVRPLSDRRRSVKQERKRCDPAGDWMLWPHTGALGKKLFPSIVTGRRCRIPGFSSR
jgi:hypothetical protein